MSTFWILISFFVVFFVSHVDLSSVPDIRIPPTIVRGPMKYRIFRPGDVIRLDCAAIGRPENIEYEWLHNGQPLNLNLNNIRSVQDGTIEITDASVFNEGFYQCFARNQWGTALSNTSHLQKAVLKIQGGSEQTTRQVAVEEGKPFTVEASPPLCFPKPAFNWEIGRFVDNNPTKLVLNRRVQTDENGNLHFAYALLDDAPTANKVYKCIVTNPNLDIKSGGSYTGITVHRSANGLRPFAPQIQFKTASPKVVLEGQDVSLRCFFSGFPEPSVTWKRNGRVVQGGRYIVQNFESELIIKKVQQSDEGEYVCSASNAASSRSEEQIIYVDVQAVPVFNHASLLPRDLNVTEGDSVSFHCGTYAEPDAQVVWLQNGKELNPHALPPKFRLSNGNRNLTIVNVCKNCGAEKSDLQVIQCNASNTHGYAFAAGYVNVLSKTVLLNRDEDAEQSVGAKDAGRYVFRCDAESDDSTPVTVRWYQVDELTGEHVQVHNASDKVVLGIDGSMTIQLAANDSEGWSVYGGTYQCRVDNGYSDDHRVVRINVRSSEIIVIPTDSETDSLSSMKASLEELWLIFIIIAACLLLLIITICCCFYCQRNRGDTYPVDEKERENGNNPEKELLDNGFQNYHRPSEGLIKGSQASLVDSWQKLNNGDGYDGDQCSLDEYGDPEIGKFAEDGSFVGVYNSTTTDRRNKGRSESRGN